MGHVDVYTSQIAAIHAGVVGVRVGVHRNKCCTWMKLLASTVDQTEFGSHTANGERVNCSAMTAAHRNLPFGMQIKVRHHGFVRCDESNSTVRNFGRNSTST